MITLFPRNEHTIDRVIRVMIGLVLLSLVWIGPQTPWGWVGLVPLITGLVGSCPVYRLFGISTWSIGKRATPQRPTGT
jgi:hypothetical protein